MTLKQLVERYYELNKQISELEKELSQLRSQLLEQMGDSTQITVDEYIVFKQPSVRISVDYKLLRESYPDIFEKFKKETPYVKLFVRKQGENGNTNGKHNNSQ